MTCEPRLLSANEPIQKNLYEKFSGNSSEGACKKITNGKHVNSVRLMKLYENIYPYLTSVQPT
jgi:hypothetical protein